MKPGTHLPNGATLIATRGAGPQVVGLAVWAQSNAPWVVWLIDTTDRACYLGHYFNNFGEAVAEFNTRRLPS